MQSSDCVVLKDGNLEVQMRLPSSTRFFLYFGVGFRLDIHKHTFAWQVSPRDEQLRGRSLLEFLFGYA